jgi:hypothetical protein
MILNIKINEYYLNNKTFKIIVKKRISVIINTTE